MSKNLFWSQTKKKKKKKLWTNQLQIQPHAGTWYHKSLTPNTAKAAGNNCNGSNFVPIPYFSVLQIDIILCVLSAVASFPSLFVILIFLELSFSK